MAIISYSNEEMATGKINDGEIIEKKPIGFDTDNGLLRPYSSLFYWSYMQSEKGSTVVEHSHKGFEIMTFVLRGEIEHYDTGYRGWKKLSAGDAQLIKTGNGYVHSERLLPGSSLFQIWTDPDLEKALNQPASCVDYPSDRFPILREKGKSTKVYTGADSPLVPDTRGLTISEISLAEGLHRYTSGRDFFVSGFVLEGELKIGNHPLYTKGFFIVKDEEGFVINSLTDSRIFMVESPLEPGYGTYAENYRM